MSRAIQIRLVVVKTVYRVLALCEEGWSGSRPGRQCLRHGPCLRYTQGSGSGNELVIMGFEGAIVMNCRLWAV